MSLEKPTTTDELVERIVQDILHDYILNALRKLKFFNYTAHFRWLEIPMDDLTELFPDIHEGPAELREPQEDEECSVIREHQLRDFLRDESVTPGDLCAHYGLDSDVVKKRFGKAYDSFYKRVHEIIKTEFPELRFGK